MTHVFDDLGVRVDAGLMHGSEGKIGKWEAEGREVSDIAYHCPECDFDLWVPLAPLSVSTLGFYNDSRFPGRSIVVLNQHYDHPTDIPESLYLDFCRDIRTAGLAVRGATGAERLNYAVFGNTISHVHCHIIPRFNSPRDPQPHRPIWESPLPKGKLTEEQVGEVSAHIVTALNASGEPRQERGLT